MIHTIHGSRASVSLGFTAARTYSYKTYKCDSQTPSNPPHNHYGVWVGAGGALSTGLRVLRMTLWASSCSPSPTARVTPANSLVQPCMVPGHMTHQATLQVAHIATRHNSDPYPTWFQSMCFTRLHCSLNKKLQNIDMLHTLHGSRTCDSPGHNAAKTDSYQTYMCSIPFVVPGHVSH